MRKYDVVDKAAQTDTYPSQFRMGVDEGGRLFVTSRDTLKKHPTSRLAMLVDSKPTYIQDGLPVLFIDCDPQFFNIILHFCRTSKHSQPSDKAILKQNTTAWTLWQTILFQANYLFSSWATKNSWKSEIKKKWDCAVLGLFFIRNCEHSDCVFEYLFKFIIDIY